MAAHYARHHCQPWIDAQDHGSARLDAQKKSGRAAEQEREDVAAKRAAWRVAQAGLSDRRLIFIDETGASTKMDRRYGRCPRGQRLDAPCPHSHWKTTTFVAGLTHSGFLAPYVLDGPMDGTVFKAPSAAFWRRPIHGSDQPSADG